MNNSKTWCRVALLLLFAFFLFSILLIFIIDPFQVYRLATLYLPPIDKTTQLYSNAGIAKSYDYDSAIVGSSVTENFRPTYMDEKMGGRFIKLCSSAGTLHNHAILLERAFTHHTMAHIVYGLDIYSLVGKTDEVAYPLPAYLYTDTILDDAPYWFNRTIFGIFLPKCFRNWGQHQDESIRDDMYCWAGQDEYGPVAMYNAVFEVPREIYSADAYLGNATANLEINLIPFIEAHPETQFDFFFPPYSAAEWSTMKSRGTLDALLPLRTLCYERLASFPNVRMYDFSAKEDWVLNISNYKDTTHYGQWINDAITDCIAAGEGLITDVHQIRQADERLRTWAEQIWNAQSWVFESTAP